MNDFRPDYRPTQTPSRGCLSLILTIAVHAGLAAFLFVGINWQSKPVNPIEIELVGAPSPAPAPPKPKPPEPEPPKPEPEPEPPKPEPPKPEPPKEPPPQPKPEIATKDPKPEKKPEPKPEPKPKPKPEPKPPPLKPIDFQKQLDQAIERTAETRKINELLEGGQRGRQNAVNPAELDAYRASIAAKVRRNLVAPPGLSGNPEAVFEIEQIMSSKGGEVINVKLNHSSGNHALDEAIERAIRKSDPLPLPDNHNLFERRLKITFRPLEE